MSSNTAEPLSFDELTDLRAHMKRHGPENPQPGSGVGHTWPWGSPGADHLVRRLLATMDACAFCGRETGGGWTEIRLYAGPGQKIGELQLPACARHREALREAYDSLGGLVRECRVTRLEVRRS